VFGLIDSSIASCRTLGSWVARQLHRKPMIVPVVADIAQDVDDAMGLNAAK